MITLQISKKKSDLLNEIENLSLKVIKDVLSGKKPPVMEEVSIAVKMMGAVSRNRVTMTNRAAIEYSMLTYVASSEQMKKYVKATSPEIRKALGSGS